MNFGSKFKIGSVLATASAAILILSHPLYAQKSILEETAAPSPLQEKALLELRTDDIIDSQDYVPTLLTADGKLENLPVRTRYYYAADTTDKTVYQDGDEYSNIEVLPDGKYRVYSADTFVYDPGTETWRTIENATIDPAAFEAVMLEQVDPTLGDLLSGTFHAHAQEDPIYPSLDGNIYVNTCTSWSQCLETPPNLAYKKTDTLWYIVEGFDGGANYETSRNYYSFDTSALEGNVSAASLYVYLGTNGGDDVDVAVTPTTFSDIASGNWDTVTDTLCSSYVNDSEFGGMVEFELNSDGKDEVDVDGTTKLAVRTKMDITATDPGLTGTRVLVETRFSEYSGTTNDPYLEITLGEEEQPAQSTTTITYASSTPGLSLETSIYFLFFAVVFTIGGLIIFSWFRDWFN